MASLQERNGSYRFIFRNHGKQHFVTLGKVSPQEANAKAAQVEYLLLRLKQRLIELPPGVGVVEFVQHDGKTPSGPPGLAAESRELTLADFQDRYLATHRDSLEGRTIGGIELHFKHMVTALGERFPVRELKLSDLQSDVDRRSKAKGMGGKRLSAATIKKEIVTLRTAWNWPGKMDLVTGRFRLQEPDTSLLTRSCDSVLTRHFCRRVRDPVRKTHSRGNGLRRSLFFVPPDS